MIQILKNFQLNIEAGKTVALVGESGSGKSTTLQLLMRLYDPDSGAVTLDGEDLKTLNPQWLRKSVGFVTQMPTLFAGTIMDNIKWVGNGQNLSDYLVDNKFLFPSIAYPRAGEPNASDEDVYSAAKQANIHTFVTQLPDKYDTVISSSATQLSGGQRQRWFKADEWKPIHMTYTCKLKLWDQYLCTSAIEFDSFANHANTTD